MFADHAITGNVLIVSQVDKDSRATFYNGYMSGEFPSGTVRSLEYKKGGPDAVSSAQGGIYVTNYRVLQRLYHYEHGITRKYNYEQVTGVIVCIVLNSLVVEFCGPRKETQEDQEHQQSLWARVGIDRVAGRRDIDYQVCIYNPIVLERIIVHC